MAFDPVWEGIHRDREWGRYPKEELIRFVAKNYYAASDRSKVSFLDLGCGAGASSWYLAREGFEVFAVDGSLAAIQRVEHLAATECLRIEACLDDATALSFGDRCIDCVIDIVCIAHNDVTDAKRIVSEAHRVLKTEGKLFSIMPAWKSDRGPYLAKGHSIFLDMPSLHALFEPLFDLKIGLSEFNEDVCRDNHPGLAHWIIEAVKRT